MSKLGEDLIAAMREVVDYVRGEPVDVIVHEFDADGTKRTYRPNQDRHGNPE